MLQNTFLTHTYVLIYYSQSTWFNDLMMCSFFVCLYVCLNNHFCMSLLMFIFTYVFIVYLCACIFLFFFFVRFLELPCYLYILYTCIFIQRTITGISSDLYPTWCKGSYWLSSYKKKISGINQLIEQDSSCFEYSCTGRNWQSRECCYADL